MNEQRNLLPPPPAIPGGGSAEEIIILSSSAGAGGGNQYHPSGESSDMYYKTRLCQNFSRGHCQYSNCSFAHGMHELRKSGSGGGSEEMMIGGARVCKMYYRTGNCMYGSACSYVHVESNNGGDGIVMCGSNSNNGGMERRSGGRKPCFSWRSTGRCSYGAYCIFVHGDQIQDSRKTERITESEKGRNSQVPEDSGRSTRNNIFTRPILTQRSIQKPGSQKLQEMKKIIDIYGDWPY